MEILRFCLPSQAAEKPNSSREGGTQTGFLLKPPARAQNRNFHKADLREQKEMGWDFWLTILLFFYCYYSI